MGSDTANRPWVRKEIAYAWDNHIPLCGVRIHGLKDQDQRTTSAGPDPFAKVSLKNGGTIADYIQPYNPIGRDSQAVYANIKASLPGLVQNAYKRS
ncbi:TIR domain-containing protein [Dietzia kunjamensis]|uniref:TIR domain-containing protein n=1 Tax=Dietzia kunjamensis TaxID=322509 RepID=UPI003B968471